MKTFWIYWWWIKSDEHSPWLRTIYSSRRRSAKDMQSYDKSNGWRLGKVHRMKVAMEAPPK